MRLLITGSNGLLGSNLVSFFLTRDIEVFTTSLHPSCPPGLKNFIRGDLLDPDFVDQLMKTVKPDVVINTVGSSNVDECEQESGFAWLTTEALEKIANSEFAYNFRAGLTTVQTAENIARFAHRYGVCLIYISTDHLFNGGRSMYSEDDEPAPVNVYGKMKLRAEARTLVVHPDAVIVRTNFYGWSPRQHPLTFGEWVYVNLKQQIPINLFTDYYFTPLEVTHLAKALETVANSKFTGVINIAGSVRCSKYDFGIALADILGLSASLIHPGTIDIAHFKAERQRDLSLSTEKFKQTFSQSLPDLREGLLRFCQEKMLLRE